MIKTILTQRIVCIVYLWCTFIRLFENSLFFNLFILCMHSTPFKCYTYKRIGTKAFNRPEMFYQYKSVIYIK